MSLLTAKEIMTDSVVSVSPDCSLLDALRLFVEEDIHGAPVVDDAGECVGVITTSDVLRAENDERDTVATERHYLRESVEFSAPDGFDETVDLQDRLAARRVADVMERGFVSVSPGTSVSEIARCLRQHRIHRVFVVDGRRLVGVVSALDLVSALEDASSVPDT